jgi:hypothetical protein
MPRDDSTSSENTTPAAQPAMKDVQEMVALETVTSKGKG